LEDLGGSAAETEFRRRARHQPPGSARSWTSSRLSKRSGGSREDNAEFRELTGRGIDLNRACVLFHDYIVAQRQAKTRTLSSRLGRKERQEDLLPNVIGNTGAVVADADFDPIAEISGRCRQGRLITLAICLSAALDGGVEPVRNQIEENPHDLLRVNVDLTRVRIQRSLERNIEALPLGAGPMIGEARALLDDRVDVGGPVLA